MATGLMHAGRLSPSRHSDVDRNRLRSNLLKDLVILQRELEALIGATPTSTSRNVLTEANIELMQAISALEKEIKTS